MGEERKPLPTPPPDRRPEPAPPPDRRPLGAVLGLVEGLPGDLRTALRIVALRDGGGGVADFEAYRLLNARRREQTPRASAVFGELVRSGLLERSRGGYFGERLRVPEPFAGVLQSALLAADAAAVPRAGAPPALADDAGERFARDALSLALTARVRPIKRTRDGRPYRRDLVAAAAHLEPSPPGVPDPALHVEGPGGGPAYMDVLATYLEDARVLVGRRDGTGSVFVAGDLDAFAALGAGAVLRDGLAVVTRMTHARLLGLADAAFTLLGLTDGWMARADLETAVAALASDVGAPVPGSGTVSEWWLPMLFRLGVVAWHDEQVHVTDRGRTLLAGQEPPAEPPPPPGSALLTPDFRLIAPREWPAVERVRLEPWLEPERADAARVLQIAREAADREMAAGGDAEAFLAALAETTARPVPDNVAATVRGWAGRHGRVALHDVTVVAVDDAALAAELAVSPRLAGLVQDVLGGRYLIVRRADRRAVREALAREGWPPSPEPTVAEQGAGAGRTSGAGRARGIARLGGPAGPAWGRRPPRT